MPDSAAASPASPPHASPRFHTTHWSMILKAGDDGPSRDEAWDHFCQHYSSTCFLGHHFNEALITHSAALATVVSFLPVRPMSLDWSNETVATGCGNRFIYIWDMRGKVRHRLSGHEGLPILVAFRPGSPELVSIAADPHVRLWHAARGEELVRQITPSEHYSHMWWNADGSSVTMMRSKGDAVVCPVVGWLGQGHLAWNTDGQRLILHTALGSVVRWDLGATGTEPAKMGIRL